MHDNNKELARKSMAHRRFIVGPRDDLTVTLDIGMGIHKNSLEMLHTPVLWVKWMSKAAAIGDGEQTCIYLSVLLSNMS
jgi:hypothetical protein